MNTTTEIVRTGAMMAYALVIVAFGCSGYFMIDSIARANESFERVGQIVAAGGTYDFSDSPKPAANTPGTSTTPQPTKLAPVVSKACYVGGCSGQICSDRQDVVSTCEWRESYACYADAVCERQASGNCGWTMDAELRSCINRAN
jgi:hypothetical protein